MVNDNGVWLTIREVCGMWGKYKRSVENAIWKDYVKARQCQFGAVWLVEYNSVVAHWGEPLDKAALERILQDVRQ